jgi:Alpha/beta hydrolase family
MLQMLLLKPCQLEVHKMVLQQVEIFLKNLNKYPLNTTFITIDGGNHYNFGDYGRQVVDNNSTISKQEQQNMTINYILTFLKDLNLKINLNFYFK